MTGRVVLGIPAFSLQQRWRQCMTRSVKRYKVNSDWAIDCTTVEFDDGRKVYSVAVIMLGLPFEYQAESRGGFNNPKDANDIFKKYVSKYKSIGSVRYLDE